MKTYGIIVAMEKEITLLRSKIDDIKVHQLCHLKFYEGIFENNKVIFAIAGIGKVNAGITTILLIEHFNPDVIINTGIAGGYQKDLKPLDIVVADKVVYSDVDMTCQAAGAYQYGQIEGFDAYFKPNVEIFHKINHRLGTILSGDQFIYDYDKVDGLVKQRFSNYEVIAFDMESAAIAQVCTLNKIKYVIIRAISDIIGSTDVFDYNYFSTQASNKVLEYVLKIISEEI
jgi:MTA/SAH nucleosidase